MKLIIFVLSLLLSTGLGEAKGWVTTKGSMRCIRTRGFSEDHLVDCIRTPLLEEEIEKKLQPNNPHGKHDLVWWHQQKKEINQQCIKEAKKDYINLLKFTESAPNKMAIGPKTRTKYMKLMCEMTAMI